MDVFISWSGKQSQAVAKALKNWLPKVIDGIQPWVSSEMEKGVPWSPEVATQLEKASAGIICLTPTNLHSAWILFEAGALSNRNKRVCPFLVGIQPSDLKSPLAQYQSTRADEKDDVFRLLKVLNAAMENNPISPEHLRKAFEDLWEELDSQLKNLPQESVQLDDFQIETRVLDVKKDFEVAKREVLEAKLGILVVANHTIPQQPNRKALDARSNYYSTLWKKVSEPGGIDYKRIVQVPDQRAGLMKDNPQLVSHLYKCIQARDRQPNPAKHIGVFWCDKWQQLTSFLVIDRAIVFVEFYALVERADGSKCSQFDRGLMIKDHTGEIPRIFERMFNDLMTYSRPMQLSDVTEFEAGEARKSAPAS